jgi:NADH:ubiquinone oxidoreductase subunit 4 (subunit M)
MFGMPFTASFEGMHLMLEAALHTHGALIAAPVALAGVITAAFLFRAFQSTFLSKADTGKIRVYKEPSSMVVLLEKTIALLVLLAVISIGLYSKPLVDLANHSSEPLSTLYQAKASQPQAGNH